MIEKLVTFLNEVVWSKPLVYGLLITGIYIAYAIFSS